MNTLDLCLVAMLGNFLKFLKLIISSVESSLLDLLKEYLTYASSHNLLFMKSANVVAL